jgi:hypothetical protein
MKTPWRILCILLLCAGCGGEPVGNGGGNGNGLGGNGNGLGNGNANGNGEEIEIPSWSEEIHPILWTRCNDCHKPGLGGTGAGGWTLFEGAAESYAGVVERVDVADPESSLLLRRGINEGFHPVNPARLSTEDEDYDTLVEWVAAGAPED